MSWYKGWSVDLKTGKDTVLNKEGKTLKDALDAMLQPKRLSNIPLRLAVVDVYNGITDTAGPVVTGVVQCGSIKPGMTVNFAPSDITGVVKSVQMYKEDIPEGETGDHVGVHVVLNPKDANPKDADPEDADSEDADPEDADPEDADPEDAVPEDADPEDANPENASMSLKRGMVVSDSSDKGNDPAKEALGFYAQIIILNHPGEIHAGYEPVLDIGTAHVKCKFEMITEKIDRRSGQLLEADPEMIMSGDAAMVLLVPMKPLVVESYSEYACLGRFSVRDMKQTVAVGVVQRVLKKGEEVDYMDENQEIDWLTWIGPYGQESGEKKAEELPGDF